MERASLLMEREWDRPWKRVFLYALTQMPNTSRAARAAGISRQTPYDAAKVDPAFAAAWVEARDIGIDLFEQVGYRRATAGEPRVETRTRTREKRGEDGMLETETETIVIESTHVSDMLYAIFLKAYRPEVYRERVDHRVTGGDGTGPVQLEVNRRPTRDRMLELAALSQELELPVIEGVARPTPPPEEE